MSIFTEHKINLPDLIRLIPEELFSGVAVDTQVDYCSKALHGKVMFYLLLYSLMSTDRLGQRGIAELYASSHFKILFNLGGKRKKLSHSSVSERLSTINPAYFSQLYEIMKARCTSRHPAERIAGLKLQRVDSSLVTEVSGRIAAYLTCGNEHKKGKMLKYTVNYD
ncbi:MAG: hypothetical protein LBK58_01935, partial [Prevotellaceae bacterium]|nr:hypothetical protein [Prevotellaceae bacterium]